MIYINIHIHIIFMQLKKKKGIFFNLNDLLVLEFLFALLIIIIITY